LSAGEAVPELAKQYAFEPLEPSVPNDPLAPDQLLALAHGEAERVRETAQAEGYAAGFEAGRAQGMAAVQAATATIGSVAEELAGVRADLEEGLQRDAVELALALAAKILAGTLAAQPERVVDVVRGALRHLADRRVITILVNPSDLEIVAAKIDELRAHAGGIEQCEVQADRRVGRGGAVVRTSEGEVDADIATQLERAREVIASELGDDSLAHSRSRSRGQAAS
jgi:flagellar biosynthesis/type III secretory pathway protein FliH